MREETTLEMEFDFPPDTYSLLSAQPRRGCSLTTHQVVANITLDETINMAIPMLNTIALSYATNSVSNSRVKS
jgi:hypothetical protein